MAYPKKLPDAHTLTELRDNGVTNAEIASQYGVTSKSVSRAMQTAMKRREGVLRPAESATVLEPESGDDLVDKTLIYGELFDFMRGYDMSVVRMAMVLQIELATLRQILSGRNDRIKRSVAHRIVKAIMAYERRYGDPPDLYAHREFLRREA